LEGGGARSEKGHEWVRPNPGMRHYRRTALVKKMGDRKQINGDTVEGHNGPASGCQGNKEGIWEWGLSRQKVKKTGKEGL